MELRHNTLPRSGHIITPRAAMHHVHRSMHARPPHNILSHIEGSNILHQTQPAFWRINQAYDLLSVALVQTD